MELPVGEGAPEPFERAIGEAMEPERAEGEIDDPDGDRGEHELVEVEFAEEGMRSPHEDGLAKEAGEDVVAEGGSADGLQAVLQPREDAEADGEQDDGGDGDGAGLARDVVGAKEPGLDGEEVEVGGVGLGEADGVEGKRDGEADEGGPQIGGGFELEREEADLHEAHAEEHGGNGVKGGGDMFSAERRKQQAIDAARGGGPEGSSGFGEGLGGLLRRRCFLLDEVIPGGEVFAIGGG